MSTITKEFTKEQLQQIIETDHVQCGEASALARIALASLEAVPVAFRSKLNPPYAGSERWDYTDHRQPDAFELENCFIERLFTVPPAPVSVPNEVISAIENLKRTLVNCNRYNYCSDAVKRLEGSCRAAMLQGADGNSPVIPDEVLSAIRKVARIRADFDDFDGDRRGIGDCLDEAEQELIVTINKHASVIAAAPQQEVKK